MTQLSLGLNVPEVLDERRAELSLCRRYRYALWRRWADGPQVLWVMLNPSTADESVDDPTIRRCIGFSKSWGFGALAVGNLFAIRATDPKAMKSAFDPVGDHNDRWLVALARESNLIVAAWGNHGSHRGRDRQVMDTSWLFLNRDVRVLRLTKAAQPEHPLRLPANLKPVEWT